MQQQIAEISPVDQDNTGTLDQHYWHALISETAAADFLDLKPRTLQAYRQKGGGPPYVLISSRCLKYRRISLKVWADARVRSSTSDDGQATA